MTNLKKALKTRFEFYKQFKNEIKEGEKEYLDLYYRLSKNVDLYR